MAFPRFTDVTEEAKDAARDGTVGAVRSGIILYRANIMATSGGAGGYPSTMEEGGCCFNVVLMDPISGWATANNVTYTHSASTSSYNYDSSGGSFDKNP